jgi:ubiquinone/menaquinone biosynthesis C-methylase UbiE
MSDKKIFIDKNKLAYDRVARQYAGDKPAEDDSRMRADCRELFIKSLSGKQVLELGCGPGVDAAFLSEAGLEVMATDFSDEFLKIVRERYPHLSTHQMDMTAPDLPENSFDGVYAFASFIHLPRRLAEETLRGIRRMIKEESVLFMSLIQSNKVSEYTIEDWGGIKDNPLLFTCYQPKEIEQLLLDSGFQKVEIHHITSPLYENLPRLVEREVSQYQILAYT